MEMAMGTGMEMELLDQPLVPIKVPLLSSLEVPHSLPSSRQHKAVVVVTLETSQLIATSSQNSQTAWTILTMFQGVNSLPPTLSSFSWTLLPFHVAHYDLG